MLTSIISFAGEDCRILTAYSEVSTSCCLSLASTWRLRDNILMSAPILSPSEAGDIRLQSLPYIKVCEFGSS